MNIAAELLFMDVFVKEGSPLLCQIDQVLIPLHLVELITIIRIEVSKSRWYGSYIAQQVDSRSIGLNALLAIMHIGIANTHHVIGNAFSVLVIYSTSIVEHHLHLMECQIVTATEAIGVTKRHPHLVVLVHLAHIAQRFHSLRGIDVDRVCEVVVVEERDALQESQSQPLVFMLSLQFTYIFIQASEYLFRIARILTQTVELQWPLQSGTP